MKEFKMQYLGETSKKQKTTKKNRMISVYFLGKSFNITVIQVYVPTTDVKEAEVD